MTIIEAYQCDVCDRKFLDVKEANDHERRHAETAALWPYGSAVEFPVTQPGVHNEGSWTQWVWGTVIRVEGESARLVESIDGSRRWCHARDLIAERI